MVIDTGIIMTDKTREINITGDVGKLKEYKKEIESSTISLSFHLSHKFCL